MSGITRFCMIVWGIEAQVPHLFVDASHARGFERSCPNEQLEEHDTSAPESFSEASSSQNTTKAHEETHSSTQNIGNNNCCHVVVYCQTKLSCDSKIPERCQHLFHWYGCASGSAGNNLLVSLAQHRQQLIRREHEPKATKLLSLCEQQAATGEHERSPRKNQGTTSQRKMNARRHQ